MFAMFKQECIGCNHRILSREMVEHVRKNNIVIIYGAGIVGEAVATYLSSLGVNKYYFSVTHARANEFFRKQSLQHKGTSKL
jgi:phosphoglycerate dehydrogenase-like enzyme